MTTLDYVADWQARLRSRLYDQFRGLPNVTAISDALAAETQALEDALQALLSLPSIDDSTGAQLHVLGRRVGQPYTGEDEPTYRLRLRARIRVNRSSGTPDDLYAVFGAALGLAGQALVVPLNPGAQVVVRSLAALDVASAAVLFDLLRDAKVAGVRLVFEWPTDADAFAFDDATGLAQTGDTYAGDAGDVSAGGDWAGSLST